MLPTDTKKRRRRSHLSRDDCLKAFEQFANRIDRMGETSDGGMFGEWNGSISVLPPGQITVTFSVTGSFGVAADLFEAVRVLRGAILPRKVTS